MILSRLLFLTASFWSVASAHLVLTYPGWRGNNLHTNGTTPDGKIKPGSLSVNWDPDTEQYTFPYGAQWVYPCGGTPTSTNRTKWPVNGGAVAFQPGWFQGHAYALIYINFGFGTEPLNMSTVAVPVFQIAGPSNDKYDGTVCLPQVPVPPSFNAKIGDNATIQVIETAQHGAALYSCVDITFADPSEVQQVDKNNCFNSSEIHFNLVYATANQNINAGSKFLPSLTFIFTVFVFLFSYFL